MCIITAVTNVHQPTLVHAEIISEEASAVLEVNLWRTGMVKVFLHGRLYIA